MSYELHGHQLDDFTHAYLVAAFWASNDESHPSGGDPIDDNYELTDLDTVSLEKMIADCVKFQDKYAAKLKKAYKIYKVVDGTSPESYAGHDFWLTRNQHGCGFWDRDLGKIGEQLTDAAHSFGGSHLEVANDKVYLL